MTSPSITREEYRKAKNKRKKDFVLGLSIHFLLFSYQS